MFKPTRILVPTDMSVYFDMAIRRVFDIASIKLFELAAINSNFRKGG